MKLNRLLFIILPLLLLTTPSFASMGDITICFPFFLLLALLMAAMLAQGKSPLVGFDISITKPPAEISSTSYKVKSYTSGGFDTVSKGRDMEGGGTHLSRGIGWVANKFTQGAGKVAEKATQGQHGTNWAKGGSGFTKAMSQRGFKYAVTSGSTKVQTAVKGIATVTKHVPILNRRLGENAARTGIVGGGALTNIEIAKQEKKENVKSLRQTLGLALLGTAGVGGVLLAKDKIKQKQGEIDKLKAKGKLSEEEKRQLKILKIQVKEAKNIASIREEHTRLSVKKAKGEASKSEIKELKSLTKELLSMRDKYAKEGGKQAKADNLFKNMTTESRWARKLAVDERRKKVQIKALDTVGSVKGRVTMMAAPGAFLVSGAGMGLRHAVKSHATKKEREELKKTIESNKTPDGKKMNADAPMTWKEKKELENLREKSKKDKAESDRLKLLAARERYLELRDRPKMLSAIFNPMGLDRGDLFKLYLKANFTGAKSAVKDILPIYYLSNTRDWAKARSEDRKEKVVTKTAPELINAINGNLAKLTTTNDQEKYKLLKDVDKQVGQLVNIMYINEKPTPGVAKHLGPELAKRLLSEDSQKILAAANAITLTTKELRDKNISAKRKEDLEKGLTQKTNNLALLLFGPLGPETLEKEKKIKPQVTTIKTQIATPAEVKLIKKELEDKEKEFDKQIEDKNDEKRKINKEIDEIIIDQRKVKGDKDGVRDKYLKRANKELDRIQEEQRQARAKQDREGVESLETKIQEKEAEIRSINKDVTKYLQGEKRNREKEKDKVFKDLDRIDVERLEEQEKIVRDRTGGRTGAYGLGLMEEVELAKTKDLKKEKDKRKVFNSYYVSPEQQRVATTNVKYLKDMYDSSVESGSPIARLFRFSLRPFAATQELRHVHSIIENISSPMWAELQRQRRAQADLLRELNQSEEAQSRSNKLLERIFPMEGGKENLYDKEKRLTSEIADLKDKIGKDRQKNASKEFIAQKETMLKAKEKELDNLKIHITDAEEKLAKTNLAINKLLNISMYEDALLLQRQLEEKQKDPTGENRRKLKKLDNKLDADFKEKEKLEMKMIELSNSGKMYSKEYSARSEELRDMERSGKEETPEYKALYSSLWMMENKKEHYTKDYRNLLRDQATLEKSIVDKYDQIDGLTGEKLKPELARASRLTKIRIGGEDLLEQRAVLRREIEIEKISPRAPSGDAIGIIKEEELKKRATLESERGLELADKERTPSMAAINIIKALGVGQHAGMDADKLVDHYKGNKDEYKKDLDDACKQTKDMKGFIDYYSGKKVEYAKDLEAANKKLKEKWEKLETVNYSDFLRQTIDEMGDPRWGSESGLHRKRLENSMLIEIGNDKELQKDNDLLRGSRRITQEFKGYLDKKDELINDGLYMGVLAESGAMSLKEAVENNKKFKELNEQNKIFNAAHEEKALDLTIQLTKTEMEEARKRGWDKRVKELQEIINGHEEELKKIHDNAVANGVALDIEEKNAQIKELKDQRQRLITTEDYAKSYGDKAEASRLHLEVSKLEDQISYLEKGIDPKKNNLEQLKNNFAQLYGKSFDEYIKDRDEFVTKREDYIQDAKMHRLGMLLLRETTIRDSLASDKEELAARGKPPRETLVQNLMQEETWNELQQFKTDFPEHSYKEFWDGASRFARLYGQKEDTYKFNAIKNESEKKIKVYKEQLDETRKQIKAKESELAKLTKDPNKVQEYKQTGTELDVLRDKYSEQYNDMKDFKDQYNSVLHPEKHLNPLKPWEYALAKPVSEKKAGSFFRDFRDDLEDRLYTGKAGRVSESASEEVSKGGEFLFKHGGKLLLGATVIAAPFLIPVAGPFISVGIGASSLGIYGGKSFIRKEAEQDIYGPAGSGGIDAVARDAFHSGNFAPHMTGRGSGAPPKSFDLAWRSQLRGTEYITKGLRVDEYGDVQPSKPGLGVPYEEIPWYIRLAKGPIESIGSTWAAKSRKLTLQVEYHAEYKNLARYIMENPSLIPEIEKRFTYQYVQMFGSIEPLVHPKQAWEMMEYKAVALNMPFQEQAKNIIILRDYAPNPMKQRMKASAIEPMLQKQTVKTLDRNILERLERSRHLFQGQAR